MAKKPLTDPDGEIRELSRDDFARAKPVNEVMPELAHEMRRLQGQRGKQKTPTKLQKTVRLSPEVVEFFKREGSGWQTRMNDVLVEHVRKHQHDQYR